MGLHAVNLRPSIDPARVGDNVTLVLSPPSKTHTGVYIFNGIALLQWMGSNIVEYFNHGTMSFDNSTGSLSLHSVTVAESGEYQIQSLNPRFLARTTLTVLEPVSNVSVRANATDLVEFNDTVSVKCFANGSSLTFQWLNGSSHITVSERVHLSDSNQTLTISNILRSDKGPFYCVVSNLINNITNGPDDVKLIVKNSKTDIFEPGANLILLCSAISSPPAQFQWDFNGARRDKVGSELKLDNVHHSQGGNYTCWAHNTITLRYRSDTKRITIKSLATVEVKPSMNPISVGQNVTFRVFPEMSIPVGVWSHESSVFLLWYPNNPPNVIPDYSQRVTFNSSSGTLLLKFVTTADSGVYALQGFDPAFTASTNLSVQVPVSNVTIRANATDLVELNDTVSLTCSASGSSLNFHWFNGSNDITVNERVQLSDENRTLTISTVLRSDKGPLYCVVSNGVSNGTSPPIVLDIRYGPSNISLTVSPHVAAHRAGSDLTLSCSSESNPPALYQWAFDETTLHQKGSQLLLANVHQNQTGNYTCWAYNNVTLRFATATTWATIIDPVSKVKIDATGQHPIVNENFTLSCGVSGPVDFIQWLKDGWPLSLNNTTTLSGDNSSLSFSPVQLTDNGNYECEASNAVSNQSSPAYKLLVSFGPEQPVITGPAIAQAGSVITFNCTASSQPPSQYSWFFNDTQVAQGSVFKSDTLTLASNGTYTCVVFNSVTGKNSSAVKELAVTDAISAAKVEPTPLRPVRSVNLTLTCEVTGSATTVEWLKDGHPLRPNDTVTLKVDNSSVYFSPVQISDEGNYRCIASDTFQNGPETPVITGITTIREGDTVTLTCSAPSQPPSQYFWTFNNGINFVGMSSKLTIHYANVSNAGWYTCMAQNWLLNTTSSTNITLNVT
ncbi:hemicentin-1-like, partial [Scleropages formosus]